jgi:hypothetical protein
MTHGIALLVTSGKSQKNAKIDQLNQWHNLMEIKFNTDNEREEFKTSFTCTCEKCGELTEYNKAHDAWFCLGCDIWTEDKCNDPECVFCKYRPLTPSLGKLHYEENTWESY